MSVPDGFMPVRVINAVKHEPVPRAFVTWTIEGGGRAEATTTIIGEALLEGVGTRPGDTHGDGTWVQPAEQRLSEPPGILDDVALVPLPDTSLRVSVVTRRAMRYPMPLWKSRPENPLGRRSSPSPTRKDTSHFPTAPATLRVDGDHEWLRGLDDANLPGQSGCTVMALSPGYRALVSVELPATPGPLRSGP